MIKVTSVPSQKLTIAKINSTKDDAYNYICKRISPAIQSEELREKCKMPSQFVVKLRPDPRDTYVEEIGEEVARRKVLRNYSKSFNKAVERGKDFLISELRGVHQI